MRRLPAAFLGLVVASCATKPAAMEPPPPPEVRTVVQYVLPPADYLTCEAEPRLPASITQDTQALAWAETVRQAGADCRSKLETLRTWTEKAKSSEAPSPR